MISRSVVVDTNILVSAAIKADSNPALILIHILSKGIIPLICPSIVQEYRDVFVRPKFKKWKFPPLWFELFLSQALWIDRDPPEWPLPGPDNDDLLFLSFAHAHGATLISGNLRDYPLEIRLDTTVIGPAEYVAWLRES